MPPAKPARPLAFSYLRFSTLEQAAGDSVRRQVELRDRWLARSGAVLDTSLTLRDEGRSAYLGEHRHNPDRNALAAFLKRVEKGDIPRGSYLVLESLDRLTREHIRPALSLLLQLIDHGIRIVQLLPSEVVYDDNAEPMTLMMAIMELSRGHSESRMKSERIGRSWANRKDKARAGEVLATKNVPGWLRVEGEGLRPVPARVATVRRMFHLARDGASIVSICKALNREKVPTFGRSGQWNPSTVQKILRGREVLGEYQPGRLAVVERVRGGKPVKVKARVKDGDPVPGYYPAVVTEAEWWAAQGSVDARRTGGGRPAKEFWNPFAGLLWCARDRAPVYLLHQGKRHAAKYVSKRPLKGDARPAKYISFPAGPFVAEVLARLREVDPREVVSGIGSTDDEVLTLTAQRAEVSARIAALRAELEGGAGEVRAAVAALRTLEEQEEQLGAEAARARAAGASPLSEAWADVRTLLDAIAAAPDPDDVRAAIKTAVRRVVERVWVLFVPVPDRSRFAAVQVHFRGGQRRHYLIYHRPAVRNQHAADRPAGTWCRSFAGPGGGFDLASKTDARDLERLLRKADPAAFFGET